MIILSRKSLLAVAAVVDVALKDCRPISAKILAMRHGLPKRHLEPVLQSLVRDGILKGTRGPHGGYQLARDRRGVTANDILRAAGTVHEAGEEPSSELVAKVVLPVLSVAEQEFGQALGRISLDDMVQRAALWNGSPRRLSSANDLSRRLAELTCPLGSPRDPTAVTGVPTDLLPNASVKDRVEAQPDVRGVKRSRPDFA